MDGTRMFSMRPAKPKKNIMTFKTRHALMAAAALFALAGTDAAAADSAALSEGFAAPAAPTRASLPDRSLPNLGRDKHGLPFYHPKQTRRMVRTTAYTHSESDHRRYGAKSAVGTTLQYNEKVRSAAADWSVYPLGTKFKIKGEPYTYVVDDYGSALVGTGTIDIYQPSRALMRQWGTRIVEIEVIEWGSSRQSLETLASRQRYRHCGKMYASLQQQNSARNRTR